MKRNSFVLVFAVGILIGFTAFAVTPQDSCAGGTGPCFGCDGVPQCVCPAPTAAMCDPGQCAIVSPTGDPEDDCSPCDPTYECVADCEW